STISGLLRLDSTNAAPNFFFINPAGVVFSGNAEIDVPAAFHVSTANYVKFPDGNFYADPKMVSTLSAAPPEAFGFLGTSRATSAINDGAVLKTTSVGRDQPMSFVGGDVSSDFGAVEAGGSDIRVVAVGGGAREIPLTGPLPAVQGNVDLRN